MAKNINKVQYYGKVLLDLTEDTIQEQYAVKGNTFHKADGSKVEGTIPLRIEPPDGHTVTAGETITLNNGYYPSTIKVRGVGNTQRNKETVPTLSDQVIKPDSGYDGLAQVAIGHVKVELPDADKILQGSSAVVKNVTPSYSWSNADGTQHYLVIGGFETEIARVDGTGTSGTDVSDTTATASDVLVNKAFHLANGNRTTGTIPIHGVADISIVADDDNSQVKTTIPMGYYSSEKNVTLSASDIGIDASKIVEGETILGVEGTAKGCIPCTFGNLLNPNSVYYTVGKGAKRTISWTGTAQTIVLRSTRTTSLNITYTYDYVVNLSEDNYQFTYASGTNSSAGGGDREYGKSYDNQLNVVNKNSLILYNSSSSYVYGYMVMIFGDTSSTQDIGDDEVTIETKK